MVGMSTLLGLEQEQEVDNMQNMTRRSRRRRSWT